MNKIVQTSRPLPGGWSTTGLDGEKATLPVTGLATSTVNSTPPQAVPESPVAGELTAKTPESGRAQSPDPLGRGAPQEGTSEMAGTPGKSTSSCTALPLSGDDETLVIVSDALTPV